MATQAQEQIGLIPATEGFQALEEKVYRTIEMYRTARQARILAEREAQQLREQMVLRDAEVETLRREVAELHHGQAEAETLRQEVLQMRRDRDEILVRVEKMLHEMDSLEEAAV